MLSDEKLLEMAREVVEPCGDQCAKCERLIENTLADYRRVRQETAEDCHEVLAKAPSIVNAATAIRIRYGLKGEKG